MSAELTVLAEAPNPVELAVEVTDAASEAKAAEMLVRCDSVLKDIEAKRTAKVKPLNGIVKEINEAAKRLSAPYAEAKGALAAKMSAWRSGEAVRLLEAMRNSAEREAYNAAAYRDDVDLAIEKGAEAEEIAKSVPKTVATPEATVRYRTDLVIDAIDMAKLAERYVLREPDRALIMADLKSGLHVDGVTYREVRTPTVYSINR